MTEKEVTVYVIDLGKSMGKRNHGREETNLEWCMHYVWDKITTAVATGRKTLFQGVIGFRTDGTNNVQGEQEGYEHISVLQDLTQILMPNIRDLRDQIRPSQTNKGDAISALVIAIQMIATKCKKLKFTRRITLVTDGLGEMEADDVAGIVSKIKEDDIQLTILGTDFDDPEFGFKEDEKDSTKAANEATFRQLADDCNGVVGTINEAVSELTIPLTKSTKLVPTFRGTLTLGDSEEYDSAITIHVERYIKTYVQRPPTASQFTVRSDLAAAGPSSAQSSMTLHEGTNGANAPKDGLTAVKNARTYQIIDEEAPGGKRDVERDDLEKGYSYGRTAVHINESDRTVTDLETTAGLEIIGFVLMDKYDRYLSMSRSEVIVAAKADGMSSMALSSLIRSLYELETFAVARLVTKEGRQPVIVLLAPYIDVKTGYECLTSHELPFAEDIRPYRFPPLDKVITVSGKNVITHRNLPSNDLMKSMSDYVDAMDLSKIGTDEDGNPAEYAQMDDTYSPVLHRINQALRWRAVHPAEDFPPPPEILTRYSKAPEELVQKAQKYLDAVAKAADVKKVPPKVKGRKRTREFEKPLSGLDVEELLGREKRTKISSENAIPEFKQMLNTTVDVRGIEDAAKQLTTIIHSYIRHSVGDSGYARSVEAIRVMREEMTELEEPAIFNDFIRDLKQKLLAGDLSGDRKEMWWHVRVNRLGLIDQKLSPVSDVSEDDAKTFLLAK